MHTFPFAWVQIETSQQRETWFSFCLDIICLFQSCYLLNISIRNEIENAETMNGKKKKKIGKGLACFASFLQTFSKNNFIFGFSVFSLTAVFSWSNTFHANRYNACNWSKLLRITTKITRIHYIKWTIGPLYCLSPGFWFLFLSIGDKRIYKHNLILNDLQKQIHELNQ